MKHPAVVVEMRYPRNMWLCTRLSIDDTLHWVNEQAGSAVWRVNDKSPQPWCQEKGEPYYHLNVIRD